MALFTGISSLNRCEILAITDAASLALIEGLETNDINTLGNLLVAIGSVILTFASLSTTSDTPENENNKIPGNL